MCLNAGHESSSHANNVGIIFLGGHPEYFNQAKVYTKTMVVD